MTAIVHQATCVVIAGRAILIEGPPGSGKTSLALRLIDRGAVLVGDDGVLLCEEAGTLIARPHPQTLGLVEVRNLGLIPFPVCTAANVALAIRLDRQAARYIEQAGQVTRGGCVVPMVTLSPHDPIQPLKAELALRHHGLAG